jgi:HEAT repeat protein
MTDTAEYTHKIFTRLSFCLICILAFYSQNNYANGWEHTSIDLDVLVTALDDPNPNMRQRAAESLGYRPQLEAANALLARLKKNEPVARVRQEIYVALGKIGENIALSSIKDCLNKEKVISVRAQCAAALGNITSPISEQLALQSLDDENNLVRTQATVSLGNFSTANVVTTLTELTKDENFAIKNNALLSLGRTGSVDAIPVLIDSLVQASNRQQILVTLSALTFLANPNTVEAIRHVYIHSDDEQIKRYALVAMANTRAQGSESLFLDALSSQDPDSRILGLVVLRSFGSSKEVPAIVERALKGSNEIFRKGSNRLLLDPLRTISELQLLNEYLKTVIRLDPAAGERLYAQAAMPKLIPRTSGTNLKIAQGLHDARWQSLYGLGYTGTEKAGEIIKAALTDHDARIRAVATRSMGVLENLRYVDSIEAMLYDEAAEVRWMAARVLGRLNNSGSVDALVKMLKDTNALVRLESAFSLGYLNAQPAKQKLSRLAELDSDKRVREAAQHAVSLIQ